MPPTWRIRDRATFAELRNGHRGHAGPVRVTWVSEPAAGTPPRIAFAVGRRVGGAVLRNRVRRQLRAVVAELADALEPGAYLVAYRGTADVAFDQLRSGVRAAVDAAGALTAGARS